MTKLRKQEQPIIDSLKPYLIRKEEDINTNNSWGFGGAIKDVYYYEVEGIEFSIHVGRASTRHSGSFRFFNLRNSYQNICSESPTKINIFVSQILGGNPEDKAKAFKSLEHGNL